MNSFAKAFLLIISIGSIASAQLVPGPSNPKPAPYPGGGGGGMGPGPGHGGGPGRPRPPRPLPPSNPYPGYPSNPYPSDPYPSNPYPSDPYPGYGQTEVRRAYIGRTVINEQLHIREMAGINNGYYSNYEVVAVRARISGTSYVTVQLLADGRVVAMQSNPYSSVDLYPDRQLILDRNVNQLRLAVSGSMYISEIEVEVRRGGGGGGGGGYNPPPSYGQQINLSVYRSVYGNDRIDLTQYIDLRRYRGLRIEQVIVNGRANYNSSFVSLLVNGNNLGQLQFNGNYTQSQTLWLNQRPIIGQGADSIVLYTQGDMSVETVTLVVR